MRHPERQEDRNTASQGDQAHQQRPCQPQGLAGEEAGTVRTLQLCFVVFVTFQRGLLVQFQRLANGSPSWSLSCSNAERKGCSIWAPVTSQTHAPVSTFDNLYPVDNKSQKINFRCAPNNERIQYSSLRVVGRTVQRRNKHQTQTIDHTKERAMLVKTFCKCY